jgi:amino acid adenylation domain-containing protein
VTVSVQQSPEPSHDFGLPNPVQPLQPLGPRQYAFWILQQLAPHSAVSNLIVVLRTKRQLRWWPLHAAADHLLARHAALRTRFPDAAGVPLRHVSAAADVQLTVEVGAATEEDLMAQLQRAVAAPFDLARELPFRVSLYQVSDGGSAVLLMLHHAVGDATSVATLMDELVRAYNGIATGTGIPDELHGAVHEAPELPGRAEDIRFWSEQLRDIETERLALSSARPSPARPTFAGGTLFTSPASETMSAVEALRRRIGSTENLVLLTAFYLTLFRHGAGPDLIVGVPITSRQAGDGVGVRVSTLPLRLSVDPGESFAQLSRKVRDTFLTGAQHGSVSVEEVLSGPGHQSPDWRVPLFRHSFNYRPWSDTEVELGGERPESPNIPRAESRLDIQLTWLGGQPPVVMTNYSTEIHDEADVERLLRHMETLLCAAAEDPDCPVVELPMATAAERAVLAAANATDRPELLEQTVCERFFAHAQVRPAAVAVIDSATTVSYGELATTARRVATRLRAEGVRSDDIVALALPRGGSMAAAVLGVWAAGACYLPLDAAHPEKRLAAQLSDAEARLVVTWPGAADGFAAGVRTVSWPDLAGEAGPADMAQPPAPTGGSPAYVIHTSGSTGRPRGVAVSHRNLTNVVHDFADRLGLNAGDAVLWSTTTAFDISGLELCMPLSAGGIVVVAGAEAQTRPRQLLDLVVKHDVKVVQATPTFWRLAVGEASSGELGGRTLLCGGEPLPAELARDLLSTGCRLFNVYGPTETTIWSTVARVDGVSEEPPPIGRPIANTTVFVSDEHGAPLPPGLLGELCIAGDGVSLGYLHRHDLTDERFPRSPAAGRHYRTGDLARWRADGVLELFGRNDRQVKLRGHRIELPEVEVALRSHLGVQDAAVVVVGDPQGDAELRAFVRPSPEAVASADLSRDLWPFLSERLPSYALPSRLMVLPDFPTTPNGKTDHAALRATDVTGATPSAGLPDDNGPDRNPELTEQLLELWRNALGRPALRERDHFFLNGGHSLLAARLAGRIGEITGKETSVREIFDHPTARQLSARLAEEG